MSFEKDWRYTEERMALRSDCLCVLLKEFGTAQVYEVDYSTKDIYECADTWISQGHQYSDGIIDYFKEYFINS